MGEVEVKRRNLYDSAVRSGSAREQLAGAPELLQTWKDDYSKSFEELSSNVGHYGGISKLEDDSYKFASELRGSEERLKNDLGGRSFFKKRMDVGKYWDVGLLGEFRDFESVVGTNYAGRFIGDVYAKLNKNGDVLVSCKKNINIGLGIVYIVSGIPGMVGGAILGALPERFITGLPTELDSPLLITGAIVGWVGMSSFMYGVFKESNTFTNPLSSGADDLEKKVSVIREALSCQNE